MTTRRSPLDSYIFTILIVIFAILNSSKGLNAQNAGNPVPAPRPLKWYKGNTHTHTINSDGDSPPADVIKWYRDHGFHFIFLTDHEFINAVGPLNESFGKKEVFEVFSGQEVTGSYNRKPYHVNGLGITTVVAPEKKASGAVQTMQRNVDGVRVAGGVPQINHPNFGWALTADDIQRIDNARLFELYNGHPLVNNLGGGGSPGVEEIWDKLLTGGKIIYGVASDDSHYFRRPGDPKAPVPGRGWIYVRAAELTQKAILDAMERGDFYASTGVELEDYSGDARAVSIKIREERGSKYRILFIGSGGRVLKETFNNPAVYNPTGRESYVRAKIIESNGKLAWIQPVILSQR